jgi:GxxExxY protein
MSFTADHGARGHARNNADRAPTALLHEAITASVLGAFFGVYRVLGSGFVEGVYARALSIELGSRGLQVESEVPVSVYYRDTEVGRFRADQVVNGVVLVELKAAERIVGAHEQQVLNYLTATRLEVGLLLNFGPRPSFKRFVLTNDRKKP